MSDPVDSAVKELREAFWDGEKPVVANDRLGLSQAERRLLALTVAVTALEKIANADYRGNRPGESIVAAGALARIDRLVGHA